jgi:hypothetical protein
MLRPTVNRLVYLEINHPSGAYDQIFISVRHLHVCWYGALSLTRGRVCRLQLLLVLASAVILGSESHGTRDQILLSQIRDFPISRLLRLTGLRWRYSTPPSHGNQLVWRTQFFRLCWAFSYVLPFITSGEPNRGHHLERLVVIQTCGNPWQRFDLYQRFRCSGNLSLLNRCSANGLPPLFVAIAAFRRCLPNLCLATVIFVTISLTAPLSAM